MPTEHEIEHDFDHVFMADTLVLLDDAPVMLVAECAGCKESLAVCRCAWDHKPYPSYRPPRTGGVVGHTDRVR